MLADFIAAVIKLKGVYIMHFNSGDKKKYNNHLEYSDSNVGYRVDLGGSDFSLNGVEIWTANNIFYRSLSYEKNGFPEIQTCRIYGRALYLFCCLYRPSFPWADGTSLPRMHAGPMHYKWPCPITAALTRRQ